MNLDVENWKRFKLKYLFDIKKGKRLTADEQTEGNNIYIGAIDANNGIANFIGQAPIHKGNTISLSYNGSVGEAFYQENDYWATDDVNALYSRYDDFNKYIGFFIVSMLRQEKYKFSYGRKWKLESMKDTEISLPIKHNPNGSIFRDKSKTYSKCGYVPDFEFMENYIKSLHYKPLTTKNRPENALPLNIEKWGEFSLNSLFEVVLSKGDIKIDEVESGLIPLVSSGETNNGVVGYIDSRGDGKAEIFKGNTITIDMFCNAFYQKDDFYAVSHGRVNILKPKFILNQYIAIFIITLIHQNKYRYSYGRALYSDEAKKMTIKLPINHKGELDFDFMENYIKSLPYGDRV
ncbi:restriction endonuclease subunit S [Campylobacter upsaliensis]|uniref:restriction endonuclease subunit S n=1 Tax=Campylobacter felis TaxID=2974565 RepID=UPI0025694566|nr:restriction endonuclease subunit S [Campylobacter felis]MDL0109684.1 restriction endonuclease subunit S [Campylobacter felis]